MVRILALDLSLTRSGFCVGAGLAECESGVLRTADLRGMERIDHIVRRVQELAQGCDVVVIEGYSYGSQGRSVFDIGELGGCVRFLLHRLGIPVVDVPPATLKKYATGRGNATKIDMVVAARERFGLHGTTDDNRCDAYLLWAMVLHQFGHPVATVPKLHSEALKRVEWPELGVPA